MIPTFNSAHSNTVSDNGDRRFQDLFSQPPSDDRGGGGGFGAGDRDRDRFGDRGENLYSIFWIQSSILYLLH